MILPSTHGTGIPTTSSTHVMMSTRDSLSVPHSMCHRAPVLCQSIIPEDTAMKGLSPSPPQSPLLAGQPLLTLPGAEPDNSLIVSEPPVSEWSAPSSPRGSGLGLFLPIQAASSNQPETSETHAVEPNLNFSTEAIARVDAFEFEKLKSVRRRTWVLERKAKEDEVFHAKRAELLAGRLSVAPPVPSKLADFDERGGVSAGTVPMARRAPLVSPRSWMSPTKRQSGRGFCIPRRAEQRRGACASGRKSEGGSCRRCCVSSLAKIQT
ncbi:hypothetical protein EDB86DRAFT_1822720 [Lactarius hatsudake]|nr:hypothetical protein EDB86DRAFT_1822720 [Lactarius hatsudake]